MIARTMSFTGEERLGKVLQRPYTRRTFQKRVDKFQEMIKEMTFQGVEATTEERRQMIAENLRYDQFCESMRSLFGSDIKSQDLKAIYRKISTNPDVAVDWSELFGYIYSGMEKDNMNKGEDVGVFTVSKRRRVGEAAGDKKRRDTLQVIQYIPSLDGYVTASQKGTLSVWNNKLRLQSCMDIHEPSWVTGCDYLPNMRRIACCTERNISILDNRNKGKIQNTFCIKPFDHSPTCMAHIPYRANLLEDTILMGDDLGYVSLITVNSKDFTMKITKGDKRNAQNFAIEPRQLANPVHRRKFHEDWVVKVKYFQELRCFASCSPSTVNSFILEDVERIVDNGCVRPVSIFKGVNAFDYCARASVIATGGVDKVIRVWHPHIFTRPTGKLLGHLFTIVDICCNEQDQHIISLSTARVFRVWDIHTLTSLQIFTDNEERPGETRISCMMFDNKYKRLFTGSSVLDVLPLTRAVQDAMQLPHKHDRPVTQVLYNIELNQVVTVRTESVIKVWEMETGKLVYQIHDAHGSNTEVTAIALDKTGYHFASGAFDGSVKVWDFGSGQQNKGLPGQTTEEDFSVIGLAYFTENSERLVAACGWNKIKLLLDTAGKGDLQVLKEFPDLYLWPKELGLAPGSNILMTRGKPLPPIGKATAQTNGSFNKEYILATHELTSMVVLLPDTLVTGCSNGNLILWNLTQGTVNKVFQMPNSEKTNSQMHHKLKISDYRVNMVNVLIHKNRMSDPDYIRRLTQHTTGLRETANKDTEYRSSQHGPKPLEMPCPTFTFTDVEQNESLFEAVHSNQAFSVNDESENLGSGETNLNHNKSTGLYSGEIQEPVAHRQQPSLLSYGQGPAGEQIQNKKAHIAATIIFDDLDNVDPDALTIVKSFAPIIVTVHQDGFIRFWELEGQVLREVTSITKRQRVGVTAVCHDQDCSLLVTGDYKGYLTLWDVGNFLEQPLSQNPELIKQMVYWRAHLSKVVSLVFINSSKAIISGSIDGSVRVWCGVRGRFVGFFGQHESFSFPTSEETSSISALPYDISEMPQIPEKGRSARQKIRPSKKFEYPLIFDNQRWKSFQRQPTSEQLSHEKYRVSVRSTEILQNKKFFTALVKPKAYNHHLETSVTGEQQLGAVFRALPVYRLYTPETPKTPDISYARNIEERNFYPPAIDNFFINFTSSKKIFRSQVHNKENEKYSRLQLPKLQNTGMKENSLQPSESSSLPLVLNRKVSIPKR